MPPLRVERHEVLLMNIPLVLLLLAMASPPEQGTRPPAEVTSAPSTPAWRGTEQLAKGWAALASGRAGDAESLAELLLQAGVRRHRATALKIPARRPGGRESPALDTHQQWAQAARRREPVPAPATARGPLDAPSAN